MHIVILSLTRRRGGGDNHGCQNSDLDPTILQFYDPTCPK